MGTVNRRCGLATLTCIFVFPLYSDGQTKRSAFYPCSDAIGSKQSMLNLDRIVASVFIALLPVFSGCGLYVPQAHELYEDRSNDTEFQNVVISNIKCELHKGIQDTLDHFNNPENQRVSWIKNWGQRLRFNLP